MHDFTPCDQQFLRYWYVMFLHYDEITDTKRQIANDLFNQSLHYQMRRGFDPSK